MRKPLIGLDNGHGLKTPGKRTPIFTDGTKSPYTGQNFMHEWEFNRAVVILLRQELLRSGFRVVEISPTSEDTTINDRWKKANSEGVDFFLSVHANALYDYWNGAHGIETCVKNGGSKESYRIGSILNAALVEATGLYDRWKKRSTSGLYERDDLGVLNHTKMPAALVECGFMDNPKEARLLLSDDYRLTCAVALAKGLCEAFDMPYVPKSTPSVPKEDEPMTAAEKKEFDALKSQVKKLEGALDDATKQIDVPKWFSKEFANDGVLELIDTPSGSYDFWRALAVSLRAQGKGSGKK